jgi:UDP-N-acetylmuramate: L-alanyl-gamma-D-glutamyl-meso-diaminopimelate ligase
MGGKGVGKRRPPFVLEGDEYDTAYWEKTAKFLHYGAEVAIVTSIEHDHIDIYPDFEDYLEAFRSFVRSLPEAGLLVAFAGDPHVRTVARDASCEVVFYGVAGEDAGDAVVHYLAAPALVTAAGTTFDLYAGGVLAGRYLCPLSGRHHLRNSVAALAAAAHGYGADLRQLAEPLARFAGVKRRQELLGTPGGVAIYDDFAHHPTAVKETLAGLRAQHPTGKLIAVFEPRSATACRNLHQQAYVSAFDSADLVLLAPLGRSNLPDKEKLDVARLAGDLRGCSKDAHAERSIEDILKRVCQTVCPGDTIVLLSNGAFGGLQEKLLAALDARATPSAE